MYVKEIKFHLVARCSLIVHQNDKVVEHFGSQYLTMCTVKNYLVDLKFYVSLQTCRPRHAFENVNCVMPIFQVCCNT